MLCCVAVPTTGRRRVPVPNAIRRGFSNTFEVKKFRCLRLLLLLGYVNDRGHYPPTGPSTSESGNVDDGHHADEVIE